MKSTFLVVVQMKLVEAIFFIQMMAGTLAPDDGVQPPPLAISYKPQKIQPKSQGFYCIHYPYSHLSICKDSTVLDR